jgi:putative transposase
MKSCIYEETYMNFKPNLRSFKEEWPWLKEADSQGLANAYMDMNTAYQNFFSGRTGYPKYKKKTDKQSYRNAMMHSDIKELVVGNKIIIPKAGPVTFRQGYDFNNIGIIKVWNITIKKTPTGKYFCSICCEVEEPNSLPHTANDIAFDLGLKDFLVDSDGCVIENPKYFNKSQESLAKEQRKLSHRTKGSNNYKKQQLRVALVHEKIKNQRNDFQHKVSWQLVAENQCIYSEDLKVRNLMKNHKLAKSIADAAWSSFLDKVEYKAAWYGRTYLKVSMFFPSTKLCHKCHFKNDELTLEDRKWTCPVCGEPLDRDENSALNILVEGRRLNNSSTPGTGGTLEVKPVDTGSNSCLEQEASLVTVGTETHRSLAGG